MRDLIPAEEQVMLFNLIHNIGDKVKIKTDSGEIMEVTIKHDASVLGGHTAVGWFEEIRGAYQLSRVIDGEMIEFHLNLDRGWYDLIDLNIKKEEYRAITPYWSRRFRNGYIVIKGKSYHPTDVVLVFSNGYAKNRPQIKVSCTALTVGVGNRDWGAPEFQQVFILKLGKKLS